MKTTRDYYDEYREHFLPVPHENATNVCRFCLGAVSGSYRQCYNCFELFLRSEAPADLRRRVVPMTVVRNPSTWYSILLTYKQGGFAEYAPVVASIAYTWLTEHAEEIRELLDGDPDMLTVVPSKRGFTFETQRLRRALGMVGPIANQLTQTLECVDGSPARRTKYTPQIFSPKGEDVRGQRIVLIEDTWITGATAVSAAGALRLAGAKRVVITPVARDFRVEFHGADHPYLSHILPAPYDITAWPRTR